ncbi:probable peptidoglycan muropeptide transporter SLC46 isoform X2 [Cylas formicarius]|nr:probable peptidoglycan muropeptide transporter SLC46 isoform X2 [Cylas formicarius]
MEGDTGNHGSRSGVLRYLSYITVEPSLIFYMLAFMITNVVEQSFFVYKACHVNHGYNKTVCDNINNEDKNITKEVQITVSNFHLWNDIFGHAGQIVLAFFMGAWSDKRGRKLPLLLGLTGKLYYSLMLVLISTQDNWPVEYIIYIATLPMSFTGADVAIFAAAFTYLVDITTPQERTMRVTLLEVGYLATFPIGIALGSYLFNNVVNHSYTVMFAINASSMTLAVLYSLLRLNWRTTPSQKPLSEANNIFLDFFDYRHVINTIRTICKKRENKRRRILIILIVMMALYVFQRDERNMMYLYCQLVFNWTVSQFSNFRTFQSALQDIVLLLAVPVLSRVFGIKDTVIIMIGAVAHSVGRIFYITADAPLVFYIGGAFAAFGPIVAPVIRSMMSKIILSSEKGKAFSILAVADNAVPLVSGVLYSKLYNLTIHTNPTSIFYLTMASQLIVLLFVLYVSIIYSEPVSDTESEETQQRCLDQEVEA